MLKQMDVVSHIEEAENGELAVEMRIF